MANKKVVPGSLTRAYRNGQGDFSPDLVGFQYTKGTPLFTLGNFGITFNTDPKSDLEFNTGVYSDVFTLNTLDLSEQESKLLVSNNILTTLNLDPNDLSKFVYYGSFVEYLRVNIEGIITKWKGSLYITDMLGGYSTAAKNTVLNYSYNTLENKSQLTIPTTFVENKFGLIDNDLGGLILDTTNISNIKLNFDKYEIKNDYGSYPLLGYTGTTDNSPYIYVTVQGEAFPTLTASTFGTFKYHLKPNDMVVDRLFFDTLSDFENVLLNRLVVPQYTSVYESPVATDSGGLITVRKSFTWPTTDGFNIDIDTTNYSAFIEGMLNMGKDFDRLKANLMSRRFVAHSIHEFDTDDGTEEETQGRKINKLLKIYGREYDEVKKYTDGIKFANVVTYDKRDNTPDELIKNIAKAMGFETIKSVSDNKLLSYIAKANQAVFEGQSRSMSIQEIDTELWRRLVINAYWLYKSKGSRKVIEFFIKLFGLGECLVNFDECVYVVDNKLDVEATFDKVEEILLLTQPSGTTIDIDRNDYPIDEQGFPRTLPNTQDYYFQMNGFWYNNGTERTVGNNPHFGPYDYGSKYFEKFSCFIDDFSGRTTVTDVNYTENVNLFTDYNNGDLEITFDDGKPIMDYGPTYAQIMTDDERVTSMTTLIGAGFTTDKSRTGRGSLKITFSPCQDDCEISPCPPYVLDTDTGIVLVQPTNPKEPPTEPLSQDCCEFYKFQYVSSTISDLFRETLSEESLNLLLMYEEMMKKKYGERVLNENTQLCYWCPPVEVICDFNIYIEVVIKVEGPEGILEVLLSEGLMTEDQITQFYEQWNTPNLQRELISKIVNYLTEKYNGYCLIVDEEFGEISEQCCKIRGGEWVDINALKQDPGDLAPSKFKVRPTESLENDLPTDPIPDWRCVLTKEIPPVPDPCVCELPEYCEYKNTISYYSNGFNILDCIGNPSNESIYNMNDTVVNDLNIWRAQRDAYIKSQIQSIMAGGQPGSTLPYLGGIEGWPTALPYTPVPTPVVGAEVQTGYDSWKLVNITDGCKDEFFGWESTLDAEGNPILNAEGYPTGQSTAPCAWEGCDNLPSGTIVTTNYEDIISLNTQKRDAAFKAKNEFMLATGPFFLSNDNYVFYNINKNVDGEPCISNCGSECDCSGDDIIITPEPCPTPEEIGLEHFLGITFFTNVSEECCTKDVTGSLVGTPPFWSNPYPQDATSRVGCWVDGNHGNQTDPCDGYTYYRVSTTTGVISWQIGNPPALTDIIPAECCTRKGYRANDKGQCIDDKAVSATGELSTPIKTK